MTGLKSLAASMLGMSPYLPWVKLPDATTSKSTCTVTESQIDWLFKTFTEHPSFLYKALFDDIGMVEHTLSEVSFNAPNCPEIMAYSWVIEVRKFIKTPVFPDPKQEEWEKLFRANPDDLKSNFTRALELHGVHVRKEPKPEAPEVVKVPTEAERLYAFFKSSSHDPDSPWSPKNRGE